MLLEQWCEEAMTRKKGLHKNALKFNDKTEESWKLYKKGEKERKVDSVRGKGEGSG